MINNKLIEKWLADNLITDSQAQVMMSGYRGVPKTERRQ